ncbi:6,7,8-trihydroxycoumarin synthase-like [Primulina eburnea]|uniref:6,7,8-trihydroxycoumarin synthase-like n=1 Tax=Primulina eburnea TaxID=1245227 RepID=UPI003C6C9F01
MASILNLLLLLLLFPFVIIFIHRWHKNTAKKTSYPPGPRGLPLIGNLLQFESLNPHLFLYNLSKKHGPIMSMKLGSVPLIIISSAKIAKEAFASNDIVISNRPYLTGQQKLSYNGQDIGFSAYNDCWRERRKISVIHLFSLKRVNSFAPIRREEVFHMIKDVSKRADKFEPIDLSETLISLSSSIICRAAFGKSYRETSSVKRTFDVLVHEVQAVLTGFFWADYFPMLGWMDKVTGMVSRLEKCFENMDSFYQELIDEHISSNRPQSMEGDILDILIKLKEGNASSVVSWDHIKGMLMNIFIAGTDTSSSVVTWAMTALVKKPDAMRRAQQEIRRIVDKKPFVDEDDIQKLPYFKAVIKETMRFYPPVPLLVPRETTQRCFIDGYEIQPKTMIYFNFWSIGRDPEYWKNPYEFSPDRFLDSKIDYKGQDFGLIPFGSGRRACPGILLGIATVELALANLLFAFDWELPDGMTKEDVDTDALPGMVMHKKNPLCLVAKSYI